MNLLSHYYFERNEENPWLHLGVILPDVSRETTRLLEKTDFSQYLDTKDFQSLLHGIERHHLVDKLFHNAPWAVQNFRFAFELLSRQPFEAIGLRKNFLAHILVEMLLDRLLMKQTPKLVVNLYESLDTINIYKLNQMLTSRLSTSAIAHFFATFESFRFHRYLFFYQDTETFTQALIRVFLRTTGGERTEKDFSCLKQCVQQVEAQIEKDFQSIFTDIETQLES